MATMHNDQLFYNMRVIDGQLFIGAGVFMELADSLRDLALQKILEGDQEGAADVEFRGTVIKSAVVQLLQSYTEMSKYLKLEDLEPEV